jgi:hypothetical protein
VSLRQSAWLSVFLVVAEGGLVTRAAFSFGRLPPALRSAMTVKRALTFRAGTQGLLCAAQEIEIESATEINRAVVRTIRPCVNLATVVWRNTGFCEDCASLVVLSPETFVIDRIVKGGDR